MNCKHVEIRGNTTKYYYCKVKGKSVDDYQCRDCMLRLPDLPERISRNIWKGVQKMTELKAKILTYIITILAVIFLRHKYIHKR